MVTNLQVYIAHRILLLPSERRLAKLRWRNNISSVASSRPADVPWMRTSLFRSNLLRRVSLKVALNAGCGETAKCPRLAAKRTLYGHRNVTRMTRSCHPADGQHAQ